MSETKRALGGQVPSPGLPLVCEISLKTSEGDSLVLELWRLAVVAGGDPSVKVPPSMFGHTGEGMVRLTYCMDKKYDTKYCTDAVMGLEAHWFSRVYCR